jgi:hypothetical protein
VNLDRARLLLLAAPTTPLWTGEVVTWNAATFALTVTTSTGAYPTEISNLLLVQNGVNIARVKSRSGNVLYLAETPVQFLATYTLAIYDARLPWPRYQYIDEGVVYKDRDIAFPTPWQREMPPTAILNARLDGNDWGEAIYCAAGETIYLDAGDSYATLDDGAPLTYAWTPGTGGTITGSGATVTCAYTTAGFRYLKLVVTDAHGTTSSRYLPVWVGDSLAVSAVTTCRARWTVNGGWTVDLEMQSATTLLQYGQALVVDADTKNALFYGFIVPSSRATTFETTTQSLTLQSALAFSRYVHAYPFLVTAVTGVEEPSEWAEMYDPTLARALWYLLYWHSTLPEVVNCDMSSAPVRAIAGQEFTLGSIPQQVEAVLKSAFWQARGARAGGFVVNVDPLFLDSADWAALSGLDLSAAGSLRNAIGREYAVPQYSQARLGGVYRAVGGTFEPALVQSPQYPGPWGSPTEVNGLAPEDVYELIDWAIRYIAVENTADTYNVEPGVVVEPDMYRVVDLPDSVRISSERLTLDFNPDGLHWRQTLGGRAYGYSIGSAEGVPLPPPVEYPPPILPPFEPPIWDPFPIEEPLWPLEVYVATLNNGIYYTDNFTGADSSVQPEWSQIVTGLDRAPTFTNYAVKRLDMDPFDAEHYQYCYIRQGSVSRGVAAVDALYRRTDKGAWAEILHMANPATDPNPSTNALLLCDWATWATYNDMAYAVDHANAGRLYAIVRRYSSSTQEIRILVSTDRGSSWSNVIYPVIDALHVGYTYFAGLGRYHFYASGDTMYFIGQSNSVDKHVYRSVDGGANFDRSGAMTAATYWLGGWCPSTPSIIYHGATNDLYIPDFGSPGGASTVVQDVLSLGSLWASTWVSPTTPAVQRILKSVSSPGLYSYLYETQDSWNTYSLISQFALVNSTNFRFKQLIQVNDDIEGADWLILAYSTTDVTAPHQHHIHVVDRDVAPNTTHAKAGIDPVTNASGTSIPVSGGGVIDDGVGYVPRS